MSQHDKNLQEKRAEILNHLRENLGEDRSGGLGDVDGVGLLTVFLRQLPTEEQADTASVSGRSLSKSDLVELRRRRRQGKRDESQPEVQPDLDIDSDAMPLGPAPDASFVESMNFSSLIEEIPQLRDNFSEWLSSVDAEFVPSSSTPEELEALRKKIEYRLKVLTIMLNETQRELDHLIVTIQANEATQDSCRSSERPESGMGDEQ
jgi:hypothetical protein